MYDLFHVLANYGRKVIDRVRVDAANKLKHIPDLRKVVKGSRYLLYKRPEELSEHEHTKLADLAKLNSPLLKCYLMGDELRHLWGLGTRPQAIALVLDWIYRTAHSRIKPLVLLRKTCAITSMESSLHANTKSTLLFFKESTIESSKLSDVLTAFTTTTTFI